MVGDVSQLAILRGWHIKDLAHCTVARSSSYESLTQHLVALLTNGKSWIKPKVLILCTSATLWPILTVFNFKRSSRDMVLFLQLILEQQFFSHSSLVPLTLRLEYSSYFLVCTWPQVEEFKHILLVLLVRELTQLFVVVNVLKHVLVGLRIVFTCCVVDMMWPVEIVQLLQVLFYVQVSLSMAHVHIYHLNVLRIW